MVGRAPGKRTDSGSLILLTSRNVRDSCVRRRTPPETNPRDPIVACWTLRGHSESRRQLRSPVQAQSGRERQCSIATTRATPGIVTVHGIGVTAVAVAPKGGRLRYVPLTIRLAAAFRDHRHLRSPNVLCQDDGQPLQMVQDRALRAARRARLSQDGVHIVRRPFCSHLAMRGAPPGAIQEAGRTPGGHGAALHAPESGALDSAIRLLDQPAVLRSFGDMLETGRVSEGKVNG